jgi:ABC-2 type transport system ATP-binding protein
MTAAALRSVSKRFGKTVALDRLDLAVEEGEVLALLGPNGAGKSTALSILLGLRRPDSGRAELFGRDPQTLTARAAIGVTPQESGFPQTLRVGEIADLVRAHFPRPAGRDDLLRRFGLLEVERRQAGGLSGGSRRRLAVALAFAGQPRAVFLDEPTTGLDVEARLSVWAELETYAAGGGTILLTTHHLEEAERLASRIVLIAAGSVVAEGTAEQLAARTSAAGLEEAFLSLIGGLS